MTPTRSRRDCWWTQTQSAFFLPSEKDRQVVAVYFSPGGTVNRVMG